MSRNGLLVALAGAALAAVAVARRRLLVIEVLGESMAPTFRDGDRLLVRRTRRFRRGDAVIAHHQEGGRRTGPSDDYGTTWLVKRVAALPGDAVPEVVAPVVGGAGRPVPSGQSVLLGDNPESADSKDWGFIPLADLEGVVMTRLGGRSTG